MFVFFCSANEKKSGREELIHFFFFNLLNFQCMKTFVPSKKEKKTKNIETRDFSTPTEWNVEMVNDKVIVTLSGKKRKILEYFF